MLISRKVTQDKIVVTDFRHLNIRIAKNNLAYHLLKDTFPVLGSPRCEVPLVIDLKDVFYSLRLLENSNRYCGILPYFGSTSYMFKECLWDYLSHLQFGIIYKCYIRMFTKQKILQGNSGWSITCSLYQINHTWQNQKTY